MSIKKVLFVCTGNTCRSPMAEVVLKNKIKLAGLKGVKVSSAGLSAVDGEKMSVNSVSALRLLGYKVGAFRSKRATAKVLLDSDLIICMTANHKAYISNYLNVYTVNEITNTGDIPDPYGQNLDAYILCSHKIEDACNIILEKLIKGEI